MNPYALFGEFIGLVAVVLIFANGHIRRYIDILEHRNQSSLSEDAVNQIESLRLEMARLRDTSTQYDISIQHTLEDLQRRVASIEAAKRPMSPQTEESQQTASVGGRQS